VYNNRSSPPPFLCEIRDVDAFRALVGSTRDCTAAILPVSFKSALLSDDAEKRRCVHGNARSTLLSFVERADVHTVRREQEHGLIKLTTQWLHTHTHKVQIDREPNERPNEAHPPH
jgi:hypothetical protein